MLIGMNITGWSVKDLMNIYPVKCSSSSIKGQILNELCWSKYVLRVFVPMRAWPCMEKVR